MSTQIESAWEKWSPTVTDIFQPLPTYWQAFQAGWEARELAPFRDSLERGLAESAAGDVTDLGSFATPSDVRPTDA